MSRRLIVIAIVALIVPFLFGLLIFSLSVISQSAYDEQNNIGTNNSNSGNEVVELQDSSPLLPPYTITEEYGYYTGAEAGFGGHYGTDMSAGLGASIYAVMDGTVVSISTGCFAGVASCGGGYGNYVTIKHNDTLYTRYGHMLSVNVTVGQNVSKGELLGFQGNTGFSTGTHLHFEVRVKDGFNHDDTRNPRNYFKF